MKKRSKTKGGDIAALVQSVANEVDREFVGTFTGDNAFDSVEAWIPSSNKALNYAIGDPRFGAFPMGRVVEIFGPKSSAKSLILYDALGQVQKQDGIAVLIDSESSFTRGFGKYLGIDIDKLIYAHMRTIEEVTDFVNEVITAIRKRDKKAPILIGWDSLAACSTLRELDEDDEDATSEMGYRARLMGRQLRKLPSRLARENVCYTVVNQTRKKIKVMFGDPTTTPGGEALPFHASIRLKVIKAKKIKRTVNGKKRMVGHKVIIFCDKNKIRPPFAQTEINIYVDRAKMRYGLDEWSGLMDLLVGDGIVTKVGKKKFEVGDIEFSESDLPEVWESHILPAIPEDLYEAPGEVENEDDEEEEDD